MNHKRIIWIIKDNKIQLYTELRKQWNVQNYNGNMYLPIEDIAKDGIFSKEEQEYLSSNYIDKICKSSGIRVDTFIHALFIYEHANNVISEIYQYFKTWVDNHNLNLNKEVIKWNYNELESFFTTMGDEAILKEHSNDNITSNIGKTFHIATSKGTIYVEKKVLATNEQSLIKGLDTNSHTAKSLKNISEKIETKIEHTNSNNSTNVCFADSPKSSKIQSMKECNKKIGNNDKKQHEKNTVNTKKVRKTKISNEELRKVLLEETKDFNYTVREPR